MSSAGNVLVDTDVVVDFLRGVQPAVRFIRDHARQLHLSAIVVAEIYAGARTNEMAGIERFVESFPVIAISTEIAAAGGSLKQQYGRSHGLGLADAIIAASALEHGLYLASQNVKHYPMFPGLEPPYTR